MLLLDQDFSHCPIFPTAALQKLEPFLSLNAAGHPLRSAKDHRLGNLLHYQQPNLTLRYL